MCMTNNSPSFCCQIRRDNTKDFILYNVNVFVRSDNTVILEVKWDNDADGTLTVMFSENDTEQMVFTLVLVIINAKK